MQDWFPLLGVDFWRDLCPFKWIRRDLGFRSQRYRRWLGTRVCEGKADHRSGDAHRASGTDEQVLTVEGRPSD